MLRRDLMTSTCRTRVPFEPVWADTHRFDEYGTLIITGRKMRGHWRYMTPDEVTLSRLQSLPRMTHAVAPVEGAPTVQVSYSHFPSAPIAVDAGGNLGDANDLRSANLGDANVSPSISIVRDSLGSPVAALAKMSSRR